MARRSVEMTAVTGGISAGDQAAPTPAASHHQVEIEIEEQIYSPAFGNIAATESRGCCSSFTASVTKILFILHLLAFIALTIFLSIEASSHQNPTYKPFANFIPLASSMILSTIAACFWTTLALSNPSKAIKTSLWTAPVLAFACGVVVFIVGDGAALGIAALIVVIAIATALYSCSATGPRLRHAAAVLATSINGAHLPFAASFLVIFVIIASFGYMAFWTVAISCIAATEGHFMNFQLVYVAALLVSMSWTMQVLRYFVYVAVAKLAYAQFFFGVRLPGGAFEAFRGTVSGPAFGDICMGAVVVPVIAAVRGLARGIYAVTDRNDDDCEDCFLAASEKMMGQANQWGFVHVGARRKAFFVASRDVWALFVVRGMAKLVDSDGTGAFCFLSAVTGGTLASVVAGSWALAMDKDKDQKDLVLPIAIYAFLIGYYMCRMVIAWQQACVAAYHVAYAENPRLGTLITDHLRELQVQPQAAD